MVRKMALALALVSLAVCADATRADDVMASQFYGSGVHRFFRGDLWNATTDFTNAIQAGTDDPRPHYFRALAYLRMGRQPEALADFAKGAELEAADINGAY
jgi:Flp pilus assembly protein TadD